MDNIDKNKDFSFLNLFNNQKKLLKSSDYLISNLKNLLQCSSDIYSCKRAISTASDYLLSLDNEVSNCALAVIAVLLEKFSEFLTGKITMDQILFGKIDQEFLRQIIEFLNTVTKCLSRKASWGNNTESNKTLLNTCLNHTINLQKEVEKILKKEKENNTSKNLPPDKKELLEKLDKYLKLLESQKNNVFG